MAFFLFQSVFVSKEGYQKAIGYREDDGKIESTTDYLKRLASYMKLYGALVQTEVQGVENIHGPNEGWAWLARFLNTLPANMFTAVALNAFLQTAGFVLFKKYRSQFRKLLNIISNDFLKALRERRDPEMNPIIVEIQSYIEDNEYLREPEGRNLQESLLSSAMGPDSESGIGYY
uniref:mRNA export factor GLE1 n=2 Tax=Rhizophora mucronata TaxID=61149 RepID=A0A2P2ILJ1_RHIMU